MNINSILAGVPCSCGKMHTCDIESVYIEKDAINRLSSELSGVTNILIVADENTYLAAGEKTERALSGKTIVKAIFPGSTVLIPDEKAIERVRRELGNAEYIIGIGSGVIQDLCKYISHFENIPYAIVATAPSMDGYASTGAAMILSGMKETVAAGLPRIIIADTDVLKNAPMEMIKAGYGDIIGKYSALCDWKLSAAVNGEYFCQYIYDTTYEMIKNTLGTARGLLSRDEKSIKTLTEALMIVGIMMSFAGSSRPASGSEHHFAHFFEIVGIVKNEKYLAHGLDVAYSTVITARIREKIQNSKLTDRIFRKPRSEYENIIREIYGPVADGCIALQDKIGNYANNRLPVYKEKWDEIESILSEMPSADEISEMLSLAGLDMSEFYDIYSEDKLRKAAAYSKDLKDRYTVLWLNYDLFGE